MGHHIIKLEDGDREYFMEWSSVVDAPVTKGMSREELREHIRERYGQNGLDELPARMERLDRTGTSSLVGETVEVTIRLNRAGRNETRLSKEQIIEYYCRQGAVGVPPLGEKS